MTSLASLDDWNAQFGDSDYTAPDKPRNRFQLQTGICYPVTIRGATLCKSKLGEIQIALDMDVRDYQTNEVVAQTKDWVSLPFQPETDMGKEKSTVVTLTRIRRNILSTLLKAVDPPRFAIAKVLEVEGGERKYQSFKDDHIMERSELDERTIETNREVLKYAEECHAMLENTTDCRLEGWDFTELYHSKKENDRNPKYPYSRYHVEPAFGIPLYDKEGTPNGNDAPF